MSVFIPAAMQAARFALPFLGNAAASAASNFVSGKTGETVGGHNEQASNQFRSDQDGRNQAATNNQSAANQESTRDAGTQGQRLSQADTILANQMGQSNKRADAATQMATYDQDNAFKNGQQLANNYTDTANRQAATSANVMSSILGSANNVQFRR